MNKGTYTAADIARYHNGGMTPAEMHALEKAALDDPFLADAVDGYMHTKTPESDMAYLRGRINRRSNNVVSIYANKRRFVLRIAALFVLLAGFGWLVYRLTFTNDPDMAIQTEKAAKPQSKVSPNTFATDSSNSKPTITPADTEAAIDRNIVVSKQNGKESNESNLKPRAHGHQTPVSKAAVAEPETFSNTHDTTVPQANDKNAITARKTLVKNSRIKVVDERNQAVPFATATDVKYNRAMGETDTAGTISLAADSATIVSINATGFLPLQTLLMPADSTTTVVLPRDESTLRDVGVTAKTKRIPTNRVRLDGVQPLEGNSHFDNYVNNNIQWPDGWNRDRDGGEVVLSFNVDKQGKAFNITVDRSVCASCDSTAVRMIRKGAKWQKTKKGSLAKAYIRF